MKIKYSVFLFVSFVISTYCALIPNDRVITSPDFTEDPNLVEGIIYKIVHSKSGLKLDSDGEKVYLSSASSPHRYWSFQKADGNRYNLVNVDSNRNLDGNGQKVYVHDYSISNPYQQWEFKKIKNHLYNIAHVKSESRNLDSNGRNVYISTSKDNSETNPFQQWSFEPSNYNLSVLVTDFKYPPD